MAKILKEDETPIVEAPKTTAGVDVFMFTCTKCNQPQRDQKMFPGTLCQPCFSAP